ncbi:MAG TPA: IS5/IS1182 family transposase, partial [Candidatus Acidoferrales bacterium]|nr:IS5/IS1182 family transposase [Candidatus Acidoferrales bacterium]
MKQQPLDVDLTYRQTRKRVFLAEREQAVPWTALLALIAPHALVARTGRLPLGLARMLRRDAAQQRFGLFDAGIADTLHDRPGHPPLRRHRSGGTRQRPPRCSNAACWKPMASHNGFSRHSAISQRAGTIPACARTDATRIAARPKHRDRVCDPDMHQAKKANPWFFGMKAASSWILAWRT